MLLISGCALSYLSETDEERDSRERMEAQSREIDKMQRDAQAWQEQTQRDFENSRREENEKIAREMEELKKLVNIK